MAQGLPEEDEPLLSPTGAPDRRHKSCAIVGNGVQLLSASYGEEIDRHEAVMRINQVRAGEAGGGGGVASTRCIATGSSADT